jgi:hypothetical protein
MNPINYETGQEVRTENTIIRQTPDEKRYLFSESQKLGISISAFLRMLVSAWRDGNVNINGKG